MFRDGKDPVVFADGFRAIFGMAWHDGSLYVCHMPFLTVVRDTDGDGKADERKDLFKDLGIPTNNQGLNDHIVSGLQFGVDGRLYISVGDKGVPKATGPDGKTAQIIGGGIAPMPPRRDRDRGLLHRDEESPRAEPRRPRQPLHLRQHRRRRRLVDPGHAPRRRRLLWLSLRLSRLPRPLPQSDGRVRRRLPLRRPRLQGRRLAREISRDGLLGRVGGRGKFRGSDFDPRGASFEVAEQIDFAVPDGLKDFRPIDLALSYDGKTLYVADWGMGGWGSKTEKVGRVFAISYTGPPIETRPRGKDSDSIEDQIKALDHPSFNERMRAQSALIAGKAFWPVAKALEDKGRSPIARRHLLWAMVTIGLESKNVDGNAEFADLAPNHLNTLITDPDPEIRAQAIRAIGMLPNAGARLEPLDDPDPTVRLQGTIASGRSRDTTTIPDLIKRLADSDPYVAFSARQALRRIDHWGPIPDFGHNLYSKLGPVTQIGLTSKDPAIRKAMLATLERVYNPETIRALARFSDEQDRPADERILALNHLAASPLQASPLGRQNGGGLGRAEAPRSPLGTSIGKAPGRSPRPSEAHSPTRTSASGSPESPGFARLRIGPPLPHLRSCFGDESEPSVRIAIISALGALNDQGALPMLAELLRDPKASEPLREASLSALESIGGELAIKSLIEVLGRYEPSDDRQVRVIAALGRGQGEIGLGADRRAALQPVDFGSSRVGDGPRTARPGRGGRRGAPAARRRSSVDVRKAAIAALAALKDRESVPIFLKAAESESTRFEATMALAAFPDIKAIQVYLRGMTERSPELRKACVKALTAIRRPGRADPRSPLRPPRIAPLGHPRAVEGLHRRQADRRMAGHGGLCRSIPTRPSAPATGSIPTPSSTAPRESLSPGRLSPRSIPTARSTSPRRSPTPTTFVPSPRPRSSLPRIAMPR